MEIVAAAAATPVKQGIYQSRKMREPVSGGKDKGNESKKEVKQPREYNTHSHLGINLWVFFLSIQKYWGTKLVTSTSTSIHVGTLYLCDNEKKFPHLRIKFLNFFVIGYFKVQ